MDIMNAAKWAEIYHFLKSKEKETHLHINKDRFIISEIKGFAHILKENHQSEYDIVH